MINKTKFNDLFFLKKKIYKDKRGYFTEIIREKVIKKKFPFLVMSFSKKYVIRGLHLQTKNSQGKFISVIKGKIFDVAIDLRQNSKTYGKVYKSMLSEENSKSLFVPPGFAHGFQALSDENYVIYSCTRYRNAKSEISLKYDDKDFKIKWPLKKKILSEKDKSALSFREYEMLKK